MRLQRLLLMKDEEYPELYVRGETILSVSDTLSFDTYYNSFCYTKYRDYTKVGTVIFSCRFTGKAKVQMCLYDGAEHIISQAECEGTAELCLDIRALPERGFVYPKITALSDCVFLEGEYSSDSVPSDINVCIAICTFKREQYVTNNIEQLRSFDFSFINRAFVVDNGRTLNAEGLSDEFIRVIPNKNFGGSGGFSRGLIEACSGGFSHVILMDDDIQLIPEIIEQMTVFISLLKQEYSEAWFSAAMLTVDKPWEQYEMGAEWNGKKAVIHKHLADIRDKTNLLDNLTNPGVRYGGWWTLCMPVSVAENGFPYPFFIKFDDVEYGLRNSAEIITMNGIAIRHEAFDLKTSFVLDYYNLRNELVVNAVHRKNNVFGAVKRFWKEAWKELLLYRYENCNLVFRAINDFLSGTEFFSSCNEEELNKELINSAIKLCPLNSIPQWNESMRCDNQKKNNGMNIKIALTLGGNLIPSFLLNKEPTAMPLSGAGVNDVFCKAEVIQYQRGGDVGVLTKRSFVKFCKYLSISVGVSLKLLFGYKKVQLNLIENHDKITSLEFWCEHLGIRI